MIYEDLYKELFDNGDYDPTSKFFFKENKKVIGKMKDKCGGIPIVEFCGLRSKMYSYLKENENWDCKAKGIKKNVIKKQIRLQHYKDALFKQEQNIIK